jgi:hypothetical protein
MRIFQNGRGQAHQDSFVLNLLSEKRNGIYLEIGSHDAVQDNNTYLLESEYDWSGVGIEIVPALVKSYNLQRKNKCVEADATTFDYLKYLREHEYPKQIDYLQLDIEPAEQTLKALKKIPLTEFRFSVITYEHDLYVDPANAVIKEEARTILNAFGYKMVLENVTAGKTNRIFEDWWVDPTVIPDSVITEFYKE